MNAIHKVNSASVDDLHKKLYWRFPSIQSDTLVRIFAAFRFAEAVHDGDFRKDKRTPYITHPIDIIEERIIDGENENPSHIANDAMVMVLHDTIEEHPDCWRAIVDSFGVVILRDVLVISKISCITRKEIYQWAIEKLEQPSGKKIKDIILRTIVAITDPGVSLQGRIDSSVYEGYGIDGQERQRLTWAMDLYHEHIIRPIVERKDICPEVKEKAIDEYESLAHYAFFRRKDAKRKLWDMLANMSDIVDMERRQPGYTEKRRIKAYILGVKLRNFGMEPEYAQLQKVFQRVGMRMYTDPEALAKFSQDLGLFSSDTDHE